MIALRPSPPNEERKPTPALKKLGKYEFSMDQRLGSGMSGDAYAGIDTDTHQLVCVKVVDRAVYTTPEQQALLDNEIRCQTACQSNHTIRLVDIFDTTSFCFIITELCEGGDLYRFLKLGENSMPEGLLLHFARQISMALLALKQAKIVHRDIKS